jgi:hypothetical protein
VLTSLLSGEYPATELYSSQPPVRNCLSTDNCLGQSESELLYVGRFTANQFVLATRPLRPTTSIFFFKLNTYGHSSYVTFSLTRGWVCRLHLLLTFASTVILRPESRWTHDHILLSQIRESSNLEGQVPVFISSRNRVAQLYLQALGFLFVANDSEGYGGSIRPRLHMVCLGRPNCLQDNSSARTTQETQPLYCCRGVFTVPLHSNGRGADHIENTVLLLLRDC